MPYKDKEKRAEYDRRYYAEVRRERDGRGTRQDERERRKAVNAYERVRGGGWAASRPRPRPEDARSARFSGALTPVLMEAVKDRIEQINGSYEVKEAYSRVRHGAEVDPKRLNLNAVLNDALADWVNKVDLRFLMPRTLQEQDPLAADK